MENATKIYRNKDGKWCVYHHEYDIIIHCDTKEENERVMELLTNEPISKKDILEIIKEIGGCDASDEFSKGFDAACDVIAEKVAGR